MENPESSQHGDHEAAHPEAPHGRAFTVRIDDQHVLIHEQHPTGEDLLKAVDKRACAYALIQVFRHDERFEIDADDIVDLGAPAADKFITAHKDIVTIIIDGKPHEIRRGSRTVAEVLGKVGKTSEAYALLEEKSGPPLPLPSDQSVCIEGCEIFHVQVQSGGSS